MILSVVWIDMAHAKIFHLSEEKMEREEVRATHIDHHTHRLNQDERDPKVMYDQIAQKLGNANRILILGPGIAKVHFMDRLRKRHPTLVKKVLACETADHPSDAEIAA